MQRVNVDIADEGPHTVIAASPGQRILVQNFVLSFAHAFDESQPAVALSGSTVLEGYLVYDGEKIFWRREPSDTMRIASGEDFKIKLADGVKCMGYVEYEIGAW